MIQNYQDAMAIYRQYENPNLFITFTCNPKWLEIIRVLVLIKGQRPEDRLYIISRRNIWNDNSLSICHRI